VVALVPAEESRSEHVGKPPLARDGVEADEVHPRKGQQHEDGV